MSGRDIVKYGLRASAVGVCIARNLRKEWSKTQVTRADSTNRCLITTDLVHASYTCVLMSPLCGKLPRCGVAVKGNASSVCSDGATTWSISMCCESRR
jgi:hypothetical protein